MQLKPKDSLRSNKTAQEGILIAKISFQNTTQIILFFLIIIIIDELHRNFLPQSTLTHPMQESKEN